MAKVGGRRPGAGRPKGAKDKATREAGGTLAQLARAHTETAINALIKIATEGESEAARVSAANALLDRGYGKPPQSHEHSGAGGGPIETRTTLDPKGLSNEALAELIAARKEDED